MCADFGNIREQLATMKEHGIVYLHVDIMDGTFVPNYTLGTDFCRFLKRESDIPLDIHLMITEPEKKISWFDFQPGEFVSVHHESTKNWRQALQLVRDAGAKPLAAINPPTPVSVLEDVIDLIDGVLVMTVNPGFGGQRFIEHSVNKTARLKEMIRTKGLDTLIEVDGGVNLETGKRLLEAGADVLVAGSFVFSSPDPIQTIKELKEM